VALFYVIAVRGPAVSSDAKVGTAPIASTKVLTGPPGTQNSSGLKEARVVEIEAATLALAKVAYQVAYGNAQVALIGAETSNVT